MDRTELIMRRRSIDEFIRADPVLVRFTRQLPSVKSPAGGLVRPEPVVLDPQQGRIVHNTRRYFDYLVNSEAGEIPDASYLLILRHTADVQVTDTFRARGEYYKVTGIHPFRTESILCAIDYEGASNRGE